MLPPKGRRGGGCKCNTARHGHATSSSSSFGSLFTHHTSIRRASFKLGYMNCWNPQSPVKPSPCHQKQNAHNCELLATTSHRASLRDTHLHPLPKIRTVLVPLCNAHGHLRRKHSTALDFIDARRHAIDKNLSVDLLERLEAFPQRAASTTRTHEESVRATI